jgi:hypothetical protein
MDNETDRINVSFGVDVPTKEIAQLLSTMEGLRRGSVEYSDTWDELKALHAHFLGRIDGECSAYMNIAKEQARQLFGM